MISREPQRPTSGGGTTFSSLFSPLSFPSSREDLFPRVHVCDRDVLRNNNTERALLEGNRARQKPEKKTSERERVTYSASVSRRFTFEKTFLVVATTWRRLANNAVFYTDSRVTFPETVSPPRPLVPLARARSPPLPRERAQPASYRSFVSSSPPSVLVDSSALFRPLCRLVRR